MDVTTTGATEIVAAGMAAATGMAVVHGLTGMAMAAETGIVGIAAAAIAAIPGTCATAQQLLWRQRRPWKTVVTLAAANNTVDQ